MQCRSLNSDSFGQTVIQFAGSMVGLDLSLLMAYNQHKFESTNLCMVVAVLTHFFTLASFLWTTVAAHSLLVGLTSSKSATSLTAVQDGVEAVARGTDCRSVTRRLLFAWGSKVLVFVVCTY